MLVVPRLSRRAIESIGRVTEIDVSDNIVCCADLNQEKLEMTEELKDHEDCRLLKSFIYFGEL